MAAMEYSSHVDAEYVVLDWAALLAPQVGLISPRNLGINS
jgi:hypothetical protein